MTQRQRIVVAGVLSLICGAVAFSLGQSARRRDALTSTIAVEVRQALNGRNTIDAARSGATSTTSAPQRPLAGHLADTWPTPKPDGRRLILQNLAMLGIGSARIAG